MPLLVREQQPVLFWPASGMLKKTELLHVCFRRFVRSSVRRRRVADCEDVHCSYGSRLFFRTWLVAVDVVVI